MTPTDLVGARRSLGASQRTLAQFLRLSERQIIRYESGRSKIPGPVAILIGILIDREIPKL